MPPARSKARKRALDILFEADLRGTPVLDLLTERIALASPPVTDYAADLVRGVTEHVARIDELISEFAEGWTLDRMPAVDRNVLRIGVYELLWAPDVPDGVAISEAVTARPRPVHRRFPRVRQRPAGPHRRPQAFPPALTPLAPPALAPPQPHPPAVASARSPASPTAHPQSRPPAVTSARSHVRPPAPAPPNSHMIVEDPG